jgi:hypothetical protein
MLLLTACGGGGGSATDVTAPSWETTTDIGVNDAIVFRFDESIEPTSLALTGSLATLVDSQTWSTSTTANDTLTLTPPAEGWYSGWQDLNVSANDTGGNAASSTTTFAVRLKFENFQAASVVIGQANFADNADNRDGVAAADTLGLAAGDPMVIDGRLWIADTTNHRVLGYDGIPTVNGADASWVIGQSTFTGSGSGTSASALSEPIGVAVDGTALYVSDSANNRVLVYDGLPLSPPGTASHVVGQAEMSAATGGCSESHFEYPEAITAVAGKLIVADWSNSRVLIWNSAPTNADNIPPDLVLGQSDFTHCTHRDDNQDGSSESQPTARTLAYPRGVWSDGERLLVADSMNHRILIWNSFPTGNFQSADLVIGQSDLVSDDTGSVVSAQRLFNPTHVWSNGLQIVVTDGLGDRVLIWNDFPTENFAPADVVLGQSTFTSTTANDDDQDGFEDATASARTLNAPYGVGVYRNKLLVSDLYNHRVLVFESN